MSSRFRDVFLILRHELRSTFRDRNTLIYAVALPIALYPAIFLVVVQLLQLQGRIEQSTELRIAIAAPDRLLTESEEDLGLAVEAFERSLAEALPHRPDQSARPVQWERVPPAEARLWDAEHAAAALEKYSAQLLLRVTQENERWRLEAFHDPLASDARGVVTALKQAWEQVREGLREHHYVERGGRSEALRVVTLSEVDTTPTDRRGNRLPALLVPMILIIMGTIGAFYPAIDATAGERERGTAETTAVLPLPRIYLATGKYLAVLTSALLAFVLNLISMWLTWPLLRPSLGGGVEAWSIGPMQILLLLLIGGLFLSFVSALLLSVAVFARTFKEGQAFLGPLYSLCLVPAMVAAVPGFELDQRTAFIPFLNAALALRAIFEGQAYEQIPALIQTGGVCLLLTGIALLLVAKNYLSEATLIGGDEGGFWARVKAARTGRLPNTRKSR